MKKIIILLLLLTACNMQKQSFSEAYHVGIITTSNKKDKSHLHYFDENLEAVYKEKIPYANVSQIWSSPHVYHDKRYYTIEGPYDKKDAKKVLEVDKDTGSINYYDVENMNLQYATVLKDKLFVSSNLNFTSHITCVSLQENMVIGHRDKEGIYDHLLISVSDSVFAFYDQEDEMVRFDVFDSNCHLIAQKDLGKAFIGLKYLILDDQIVLGVNDFDSKVITVNTNTYEVNLVDITVSYLNEMLLYKDKIVALHSNHFDEEPSTISFMDPDSFEVLDTVTLDMHLNHIQIFEDVLYGDVSSVGKPHYIYSFDLEDNLNLLNKKEIKLDNNSYISSLFTR